MTDGPNEGGTLDFEMGGEVLGADGIFGRAGVLPAMGRRDRVDLKDGGARAQLGGRNAHHGRFRASVEGPAQFHREIPLTHNAAGLDVSPRRVKLFLAKAEGQDLWADCTPTGV